MNEVTSDTVSDTTITDIRNDLIVVFKQLRNGSLEAKDAVEINNTAGKIISSAKVQLAYHALRGERPEIAFLGSAKLLGSTSDGAPSLPNAST